MKITSLLENTTSRADIQTEHGLSLYIETDHHRILFDMGQSDLFLKNAMTLGINLTLVDFAVLSHGHYDHGGGLGAFLELNHHAPVYVHQDAFIPHYNGTEKYIGIDSSLKKDPRIVFTLDDYHIDGNISLFSCNSKERSHDFGSFGLYEKTGSEFIPDDFRHEQYLLIHENNKRILISGCSHKGIIDIVNWFEPDVLVGGFHFSKMELGAALEEASLVLDACPTRFYTCHCTGIPQFNFMKQFMSKLYYLSCGDTIYI